MNNTINLVATVDRLRRDFPEQCAGRNFARNIASMDYPIDRSCLSGKLAEFLADNIMTTRFDDDAGRLSIFTGRSTAADMARRGVSGVFAPIEQREPPDLGNLTAYAEWLDQESIRMAGAANAVRRLARLHGEGTAPVIETYRWPVFNDTYEDAADYLNKCATDIRRRGLPFDAGLQLATPPDSLLESIDRGTFAKFRKYRDRQAAAKPLTV